MIDQNSEKVRLWRRLRRFLCSHPDTYEEWAEIDRDYKLGLTSLPVVTSLRTLWRCELCGKEVRRSRRKPDGSLVRSGESTDPGRPISPRSIP